MAGLIRVLKVRSSALTTSFRYPHIMIGKLPTFEMPPPATIYGHLCGVLGNWFEPEGLEFAYIFTHQGISEDLELVHMIEKASGRQDKSLGGLAINIKGSLNVQKRQFLFKPSMTLYLKGTDQLLEQFREKFMSPEFAYILGRSQDLATCHGAEWIELSSSDRAFFSHTLLPWNLRPFVLPGQPVYMPQSINYRELREPIFERYLQLGQRPLRIFAEGVEEDIISREPFVNMWVDNAEVKTFLGHDLPRGVWFHPVSGLGVA